MVKQNLKKNEKKTDYLKKVGSDYPCRMSDPSHHYYKWSLYH